MGSFTSSCTYNNGDHEDNDVKLPESINGDDLLALFQKEAATIGAQFERAFLRTNPAAKTPTPTPTTTTTTTSTSSLRVMQWNVLSQTIGQNYDNFVLTPRHALEWKHRRVLILREILTYMPDVICLQEVDHFEFLNRTLSTQGYVGLFYPKPDSPCLHVKDNNGPDGCAVFFSKDRFEAMKSKETVLQVWTIKSNQVAISVLLRDVVTGQSVCVATTHLKARSGALMSSIRREQGRALLDFVNSNSCGDSTAVVICGDFNAQPDEPVYELLLQSPLNLGSAYAQADANCEEPAYTSWKVREDGEHRQTLDYIFYSKNRIEVDSVLQFPTEGEIGECRLPSSTYPSDHLSLVCDLSFK